MTQGEKERPLGGRRTETDRGAPPHMRTLNRQERGRERTAHGRDLERHPVTFRGGQRETLGRQDNESRASAYTYERSSGLRLLLTTSEFVKCIRGRNGHRPHGRYRFVIWIGNAAYSSEGESARLRESTQRQTPSDLGLCCEC
ncbi:hypothetical protein SAM23877_6077 [Streptomyces ambofaciens ATCC 23877]|uniref:Uncharacterized protein n=1 Tax=Streptomyces ambofaciens (strain ATCC 23877 / 3486 / DSM 40053 / JCM 4204 / NBRC 12836 / NRRL B-2516) TaxID=278992 RepID=A0A0K2B209_STRA7|nr:hypothetical protein SAM23877_6077 [Streptomyces ambofaciens ATCC 23877]